MYKRKTMIIISMLSSLLFSAVALADVNDERRFDFDLNSGGSFSIANVNGDLEIRVGNTTSVVANLRASSQELLDRIEINIDESNSRVVIDTELPNRIRRGHASVDYVVTLPAGVELNRATTVNGDVDITDIEGDIKAQTVNGDINADNLSGDIDLETVNGGIDASFLTMGGSDSIKMDTVNGSIVVDIPANADVTVEAENMNGGLSVDDMTIVKQHKNRWGPGKSVEATNGSGSARMVAESVNGSIKIRRG